MMKAAVCVFALMLVVAEAGSPLGVVYPFPIDTILKCRVPNDTHPDGISEVPTPLIPLYSFGNDDGPWLPHPVPFRAPPGTIDAPWLIPALPGGGLMEGIHFLDCSEEGNPAMSPVGSGMLPPVGDTLNQSNLQLESLGFGANEQAVIRRFWGEVGFPDCDTPIYEVTRLPDHYYPPCIAGGRCSGESCSLPEGHRCLPSPLNTLELPVFRWDCCWDYDGAVWRWACGMYLVNIQIISRCFCGCRVVFSTI